MLHNHLGNFSALECRFAALEAKCASVCDAGNLSAEALDVKLREFQVVVTKQIIESVLGHV